MENVKVPVELQHFFKHEKEERRSFLIQVVFGFKVQLKKFTKKHYKRYK